MLLKWLHELTFPPATQNWRLKRLPTHSLPPSMYLPLLKQHRQMTKELNQKLLNSRAAILTVFCAGKKVCLAFNWNPCRVTTQGQCKVEVDWSLPTLQSNANPAQPLNGLKWTADHSKCIAEERENNITWTLCSYFYTVSSSQWEITRHAKRIIWI